MAAPTGSMAGPPHSRRPRLSLQTKPIHHGPSVRSRNSFAHADPKSPTAFNTLSNVYVTAIERSTPTQSTPLTAIRLPPRLKLRTDSDTLWSHQQRVQTPSTALPNTPPSANPISPSQPMDIVYPSTMTPTPPLSAGPVDSGHPMFTFPSMETDRQALHLPPTPTRRRVSFGGFSPVIKAPYSHNGSLHSILRNSPLRPLGVKPPSSPRRKSVRLQEKAARRVGYESPLTRTITTEKYTKSHIDLLVEEASPYTPSPVPEDTDIDLTLAYSGDEIKDGGLTPGPFEEMRRQMTSLAAATPILSPRSDGVRRRKRKEKKRKWVWTIGKEDEGSENCAAAALRAAVGEASTPKATTVTEPLTAIQDSPATPGLELAIEGDDDHMDLDVSETNTIHSSRAVTPCGIDHDAETPSTDHNLVVSLESSLAKNEHIASAEQPDPEAGNRRDTPIPPDLVEISEKSYQVL
ncbi:hypothetical protein F5B17DRAFT_187931 [Nemania serpens]|nr:hypothetical protein F5B17DRAFT_187931 [Nemania serpens]